MTNVGGKIIVNFFYKYFAASPLKAYYVLIKYFEFITKYNACVQTLLCNAYKSDLSLETAVFQIVFNSFIRLRRVHRQRF